LTVLKEAGIVRVSVEAQRRIYHLELAGFIELELWLQNIKKFWSGRLNVLENQLRKSSVKSRRRKNGHKTRRTSDLSGKFMRQPAVRFERILPGPIERVWEFLTETERLPGWFGHGVIEHRAGGAVTLLDGHIRGVVTQWKPPRLLAYTWNVFSPGDEETHYPNPT